MPSPFIIADEEGRQKALNEIAHLDLDDKKWEITVKRHRKRRSLNQNRMYWAWVTEVADAVSDYTGYERDEIHEFFKQNFLPGRTIEIAGMEAEHRTTTKLDTKEMSEYCDRIHRWASTELGHTLPLPPERAYDSDGRPLDEKLTVAEAIERSEEKTWDAKRANGADDDWGIVAADIIALIDQAPNADCLEEITALRERELTAMEENAPAHYTRVMQAMEVRGLDLDRKDPAAQSPQGDPVQHPLEAG